MARWLFPRGLREAGCEERLRQVPARVRDARVCLLPVSGGGDGGKSRQIARAFEVPGGSSGEGRGVFGQGEPLKLFSCPPPLPIKPLGSGASPIGARRRQPGRAPQTPRPGRGAGATAWGPSGGRFGEGAAHFRAGPALQRQRGQRGALMCPAGCPHACGGTAGPRDGTGRGVKGGRAGGGSGGPSRRP